MQLSTQQLHFFNTFGYLVVRGLLSPAEVERVTDAFEWTMQNWGGGHDHDMEICLADRSSMRHRLILGRSFLRNGYIVNPSRQVVQGAERSEDRIRIERSD